MGSPLTFKASFSTLLDSSGSCSFMQGMAILKHKSGHFPFHFLFLNFQHSFFHRFADKLPSGKHTAFGPLLTSFYSLGFLLIFTETAIASD